MKGFLLKAIILIAMFLVGCLAFVDTSSAQCYSGGYCPPTHSASYGHYTYPGASTQYVRYSQWWWAVYPKNTAYYYRIRNAYDCYGNPTLQHDHWLYCRYWDGCKYDYRQHCLIEKLYPSIASLNFPVEKVVYREVPVLVSPEKVGNTEYGGFPLESNYSPSYYRHSQSGVRYVPDPPTDLGSLLKLKGVVDNGVTVQEFISLAKVMSDGTAKVAIAAQQVERERNQGDQAVATILAQGAVADNIAARVLQNAAGLGPQNLVTEEGIVSAQGANALSVVINNSCIECHNPQTKKGGLDLTATDDFGQEEWLKIYTQVATKSMPPASTGKHLNAQQLKLFEAMVLAK